MSTCNMVFCILQILLAQVIDQDHNDCVIGFDELQCLGDDE